MRDTDITSLPNELIAHILSYLTEIDDLVSAHVSCEKFAAIIDYYQKVNTTDKKRYCKIFQPGNTVQNADFLVSLQATDPDWTSLYNKVPDKIKENIIKNEYLKIKNKQHTKNLTEIFLHTVKTNRSQEINTLNDLLKKLTGRKGDTWWKFGRLTEDIAYFCPYSTWSPFKFNLLKKFLLLENEKMTQDIDLILKINVLWCENNIDSHPLCHMHNDLASIARRKKLPQTLSQYAENKNNQETLKNIVDLTCKDRHTKKDMARWAIKNREYIILERLLENNTIYVKRKKLLDQWRAILKNNEDDEAVQNQEKVARILMITWFLDRKTKIETCEYLYSLKNSVLKKDTELGSLYRTLQKELPNNNLPNIDSPIDYLYFSCRPLIFEADSPASKLLSIIGSPFLWPILLIFGAACLFAHIVLCSILFGFKSIFTQESICFFEDFSPPHLLVEDIEYNITDALVSTLMGNHTLLNNPLNNIRVLDYLFIFPLLFILCAWVLSLEMTSRYAPLMQVGAWVVFALLILPYGILRSIEFFIIKLVAAIITLLAMPAILAYETGVAISDYGVSFFKTEQKLTETQNTDLKND